MSAIARYFRSASLTGFVEIARSAGLSPFAMIDAAGLPRGCVIEPELRIPAAATVQLLENCAREAGAEDFGLRMAETRNYAALGALGLVLREQPTLRDAFHATARFMRLTTDAMFVQLEEAGEIAICSMRMNIGRRVSARQMSELQTANMYQTICALVGSRWRPTAVCFSRAAPENLQTHHRLFGDTVEFGHEFDGVVLPISALDAPIPGADPAIARHTERYAEHLGGRVGATFLEEVRERILALLPSGACCIDRVAAHLGVDQRTIQRRLKAEGWTFSSLLREIRCEYAAHYLTTGRRSLSDVAGLLGFSAQSSFTYWFREIYGCPPSQWREAQRRAAIAGPTGRTNA